MPHDFSKVNRKWLAAYLIISIAFTVLVVNFSALTASLSAQLKIQAVIQHRLDTQAMQAKSLALESHRQALIVAKNQQVGTRFFLNVCLASKTLLKLQAENLTEQAYLDEKAGRIFIKKHEYDLADLAQTRANKRRRIAAQLKVLGRPACGFVYTNPATGKIQKMRPAPLLKKH